MILKNRIALAEMTLTLTMEKWIFFFSFTFQKKLFSSVRLSRDVAREKGRGDILNLNRDKRIRHGSGQFCNLRFWEERFRDEARNGALPLIISARD